jgi:hypothetical protein
MPFFRRQWSSETSLQILKAFINATLSSRFKKPLELVWISPFSVLPLRCACFFHAATQFVRHSVRVSATEAASLGLLSDPANDAAAYAAENIEGGMVKFRQSGQLL